MPDYVVIGGGSIGRLLAARLSEDPAVRVCLLAPEPDPRRRLRPSFHFRRATAPCTDVQLQLGGRRLAWPRVVADTLPVIRGERLDWSALGCPGWDLDDLVSNHGQGATPPPSADRPSVPAGGRPALLARAVRDSLPALDGVPADGRMLSIAPVAPLSAAIRSRRNLTVIHDTRVTRLVIHHGRCVAVQYLRDGDPGEVLVEREVLLAAGPVTSPHLLLLSGIGPADDIARHGVQPVHDLPGVGANLQDRYTVAPVFRFRDGAAGGGRLSALARRGVVAVAGMTAPRCGPIAAGYLRSQRDLTGPDLLLHLLPATPLSRRSPWPGRPGFALSLSLIHPESRGRLTLAGADPLQDPRLDPAYMAHPADRAALRQGMETVRRLVAQDPLARWTGGETCPGTGCHSVAELDQALQQHGQAVGRPVGTCRMGMDPLAVVDADLRLRGVEGIRIVDASVMPSLPLSDPTALALLMAARAVDLIREERTSTQGRRVAAE